MEEMVKAYLDAINTFGGGVIVGIITLGVIDYLRRFVAYWRGGCGFCGAAREAWYVVDGYWR